MTTLCVGKMQREGSQGEKRVCGGGVHLIQYTLVGLQLGPLGE